MRIFNLLLVLIVCEAFPANGAEARRPNVLMIAVDDLNDWVGCLQGHPQVKTPHIDALAARGTVFTNAHCQAPLCNPSRASLLTGLRPSTTGIYALQPGIRAVSKLRDHVTLPQTFTQAGYYTSTCGKIFHDGSITPKDQPREFGKWGPAPGMPRPAKKFVQTPSPHPLVDWGVFPADDRLQADWLIADAAVTELKSLPSERPFFPRGRLSVAARSVLCLAEVVRSLPDGPTSAAAVQGR